MEKAYPNLKTFCQEEGYEFQVVDMRWGVRDEATDDHMGTDLCLREVELCKKLSTGPCFVVGFKITLQDPFIAGTLSFWIVCGEK